MGNDNRRRREAKVSRRAKRNRPGQSAPQHQPDPLEDVRVALRDADPLKLLTFASGLMAATDPRNRNSFARADADSETLSREELLGIFIDTPRAETTALLAALSELVHDDDVLRARMRRELAARVFEGHGWLTTLAQHETYRAVRMSHILGDGDDIILGTRLATGGEFTTVLYIDHNMGTIVKDAFVVPVAIEVIVADLKRFTDDPDARWDEISFADARAWAREAIDRGAITFPPIETEMWPSTRALVEWIIRQLPEGGEAYQRPEFSKSEVRAIARRFFKSVQGIDRDLPIYRDLLDYVLWYGTDYGPGDPLRWSPVKVEILLADWIPRKIVAPPSELALIPDVLRAFIRFAHAEVAIRDQLTDEALAAVDHWEPEYQKLIRSDRPQGAAALLGALGVDVADSDFAADDDDSLVAAAEHMLDRFELTVGSAEALEQLDDHPLPDEPFRWDGVADDIADRVGEVLSLMDRCCDDLLDVEHRTACRRLLAAAVHGDPDVFRRKGRVEAAAAAVVWLIGKANDLFSIYGSSGRMQVKELMAYFELTGSVSQRANTLLAAAGIRSESYNFRLGSPDYLVSARRRFLIEERDRYRELISGT